MQAVSKTQVKATRETEENILSNVNNKGNTILNYLAQVKEFLLSDIKIVKSEYNSSGSRDNEFSPDESYKRSSEAKNARLTANSKNQVLFR